MTRTVDLRSLHHRNEIAFTDLSALIGAAVWLLVTVTAELGAIERALALAPLVLVPLGMGMAATPAFRGRAGVLYDAAVVLQPIGAALFLGSLLMPSGGMTAAILATAWIPATGLLGLAALARIHDRGLWPLSGTITDTDVSALALDAGFLYANVGAVALVLYHLGITFWFSPVIILLTAVHFHYAGFVLPIVTGLAGRCGTTASDPLFRLLTAGVLIGPAIIAVGISFSPLVEIVAVSVFSLVVIALGGYVIVRIVPSRPPTQGLLLTASAITLPVSMLLALGFVVATVVGFDPLGLTIPRMVSLHGNLNAFGFALLGLVGWRLAVPAAER